MGERTGGQRLRWEAQRCLVPWEVLSGSGDRGWELTLGEAARGTGMDELGEPTLQVLLPSGHGLPILLLPPQAWRLAFPGLSAHDCTVEPCRSSRSPTSCPSPLP